MKFRKRSMNRLAVLSPMKEDRRSSEWAQLSGQKMRLLLRAIEVVTGVAMTSKKPTWDKALCPTPPLLGKKRRVPPTRGEMDDG
ncbi:hypothetical protein R1sor_027584 [Riccia sorocarpa]|uniref:Uncharacterized protein n=1 Tax=Riccia sorocarpa TaxID=122646 RepID=A0ABD3GIA4_9MARC